MDKVKKIKQRKIKHKLILHKTNLKKEDISDRIITISAPQRVGKSSFIVAFIRQFFKYQNKQRFKETNNFIDELNSIRLDGKKCYHLSKSYFGHYIYSSKKFPFFLDKKYKQKTIELDPKELGLPNIENTFKHLPYGSTIIIDEADEIWPNRDWQDTPIEFINLLKYIGHNHLTLILITQVYGNLEKKIRELSMEHYHILGRTFKPRFLFRKPKFIWYYDITYPQEVLRYSEFKDLGMDISKPRVDHCKFIYKDNPHKYYNSKSGLPLYLYNIEDYVYAEHPDDESLDRKSVELLARKNPEYVYEFNLDKEYKFYKLLDKRNKLKKMKFDLFSEYEEYSKEISLDN